MLISELIEILQHTKKITGDINIIFEDYSSEQQFEINNTIWSISNNKNKVKLTNYK